MVVSFSVHVKGSVPVSSTSGGAGDDDSGHPSGTDAGTDSAEGEDVTTFSSPRTVPRAGTLHCGATLSPSTAVSASLPGARDIPTPCVLIATRRGSCPQLCNELLPIGQDEALMQMALLDFVMFNPNDRLRGVDVFRPYNEHVLRHSGAEGDANRPNARGGAHGFCALADRALVLSFRAAGSQDFLLGVGAAKGALQGDLRGQKQRVSVSVEDVCELQAEMRCELVEAPSVAATSGDARPKETRASVQRSLALLNAFLDVRRGSPTARVGGVLAPLQGGMSVASRRAHAEALAEHAGELSGIVLSGYQVGESRSQLDHTLKAAIDALPEHLPRFMVGDGSPELYLQAVACGVDVLECSYPFDMAEYGMALDLQQGRSINMYDRRLSRSKGPLVKGCKCGACRRHCRGYIHHLLNVHEMLADTLLSMHNLYDYMRFVERTRQAIVDDRFAALCENFERLRREIPVEQSADGDLERDIPTDS